MNAEKIGLCKDASNRQEIESLSNMWLFFLSFPWQYWPYCGFFCSATVSHIIVVLLFVPETLMSALFYIPFPWEHAIFSPCFLISSILRIHSSMSLVQFLLTSGSHIAKCLKPALHCVYCPSPRSSSVLLNAY